MSLRGVLRHIRVLLLLASQLAGAVASGETHTDLPVAAGTRSVSLSVHCCGGEGRHALPDATHVCRACICKLQQGGTTRQDSVGSLRPVPAFVMPSEGPACLTAQPLRTSGLRGPPGA